MPDRVEFAAQAGAYGATPGPSPTTSHPTPLAQGFRNDRYSANSPKSGLRTNSNELSSKLDPFPGPPTGSTNSCNTKRHIDRSTRRGSSVRKVFASTFPLKKRFPDPSFSDPSAAGNGTPCTEKERLCQRRPSTWPSTHTLPR